MSVLDVRLEAQSEYFENSEKEAELFLYLELKAAETGDNNARVPLNVCLVLDRSGSMGGDKIHYVKEAANFVVDNLSRDDYLSLVEYDHEIAVLQKAETVRDKNLIKRRIAEITARGSTNLSGGIFEGYEQAHTSVNEHRVNRVLLLSDGLANQGITEPVKLCALAAQWFREKGISLSTFGVGSDYNEDLMTELSENGGGNYYFIESPDRIPDIFAEELQGLLTVVAQNCKMTLEFPGSFVSCDKVYGYPAQIRNGAVEIMLNDLFSNQQKAVLFKLSLKPELSEDITFDLSVRYDDALESMSRITEQRQLRIRREAEPGKHKHAANPRVAAQIVLFTSNEMFSDVLALADARQFDEAENLLRQLKSYLEGYQNAVSDNEEINHLYKSVLNYEERLLRMREMDQYEYSLSQKMGKYNSHLIAKKMAFLQMREENRRRK
jgi:Ca-activated chloride channel family protein